MVDPVGIIYLDAVLKENVFYTTFVNYNAEDDRI